MNEEKKSIDSELFELKFKMTVPMQTLDPSEHVTEVKGWIFWVEEGWFNRMAGRISLTLYHIDQAVVDGADPFAVFDCLSEAAMELHNQLYDGFDFRDEVMAVVEDVLNPSLLVIESVEVLPQFRGGGLGLAAALKAMRMFGPSAGVVALLAAPITQPFWHKQMQMDAFPPDSPEVRRNLGKYWEKLGFRPLGTGGYYLRNMQNLPTISDVFAESTKDT